MTQEFWGFCNILGLYCTFFNVQNLAHINRRSEIRCHHRTPGPQFPYYTEILAIHEHLKQKVAYLHSHGFS